MDKMEKEASHDEGLKAVRTTDLVNAGGILLDIEGRESSLKTAKDGHVGIPKRYDGNSLTCLDNFDPPTDRGSKRSSQLVNDQKALHPFYHCMGSPLRRFTCHSRYSLHLPARCTMGYGAQQSQLRQ